MGIYNIDSFTDRVKGNSYVGRGIVTGMTPDGKAASAYFIMGRSANSRNRIFVTEGTGIRTEAFDPSKMEDPSLIIYHPVRELGNGLIVTNGDQTDTIWEYLAKGESWEAAPAVKFCFAKKLRQSYKNLTYFCQISAALGVQFFLNFDFF